MTIAFVQPPRRPAAIATPATAAASFTWRGRCSRPARTAITATTRASAAIFVTATKKTPWSISMRLTIGLPSTTGPWIATIRTKVLRSRSWATVAVSTASTMTEFLPARLATPSTAAIGSSGLRANQPRNVRLALPSRRAIRWTQYRSAAEECNAFGAPPHRVSRASARARDPDMEATARRTPVRRALRRRGSGADEPLPVLVDDLHVLVEGLALRELRRHRGHRGIDRGVVGGQALGRQDLLEDRLELLGIDADGHVAG